jgi:hypothetical protein
VIFAAAADHQKSGRTPAEGNEHLLDICPSEDRRPTQDSSAVVIGRHEHPRACSNQAAPYTTLTPPIDQIANTIRLAGGARSATSSPQRLDINADHLPPEV